MARKVNPVPNAAIQSKGSTSINARRFTAPGARSKHKWYCGVLLLIVSGNAFSEDYYQRRDYGSDSLYSPLGNFLSYTFDSLQLPDSFDTSDFGSNLDTVFNNLGHPREAIDEEGGFGRFVNRQILPYDTEYSDEWSSILPNYFLHFLGGGMVYRKDLEYFRKHKAAYPAGYAATLAMTAEILQEVLEKKTTTQDDEVADIYIFRPLGIILFHSDNFAKGFMKYFDPAIWPYLQVYDVTEKRMFNTGINYVYRPPITEFGNSRLFLFTGLNNLLGLSHRRDGNEWLSWGVGLSTQKVDFNKDLQAELEPSAGVFYDRNKSLLWSFVINGTGGRRFRFNLYPFSTQGMGSLGYFISSQENNDWSFGVVYRFQLGIGATL